MTQVSSELEIVAVRASMEADSRGDHIGRGATLLFNRLRDRILPVMPATWLLLVTLRTIQGWPLISSPHHHKVNHKSEQSILDDLIFYNSRLRQQSLQFAFRNQLQAITHRPHLLHPL
jgi:hypothetical protein